MMACASKHLAQLIDAKTKISKDCRPKKFEDEIAKLEDLDLIAGLSVQEYAELLSMSDEECAKQQEMKKEI
jgi:hypothetical protein